MPDFDEWKAEGDDWIESPELWEHQGQTLTVGDLARVLAAIDPALPVRVAVYHGTAQHEVCEAVELGYFGEEDRPDGLLITITQLGQ